MGDMSRRALLERICAEHGILAVYTFGSRADDGPRILRGEPVSREGSDLDVGVVFESSDLDFGALGALQVALEDVFEPLRVDLVPLQRVDAIFQFHAVDGHLVFARDETKVNLYELEVMRRAAELIPIQRGIEREVFGVSTT
jgi:predicted nucleotidyltransferase